jgi:hypothetical protein
VKRGGRLVANAHFGAAVEPAGRIFTDRVNMGGLTGYLTRPETAEIRIGPLSLEVRGKNIPHDEGGQLTSGQVEHIAIITLIGAMIGLGFGFALQRGMIKF